jgi:hypothetical protein
MMPVCLRVPSEGELIAIDGFAFTPVVARNFPIAVTQRLDIRVKVPRGAGAHPVLAVLAFNSGNAHRRPASPLCHQRTFAASRRSKATLASGK